MPTVPTAIERLLTPGRGTIAVDEHPELVAQALGLDVAGPEERHRFRETLLATPDLDRWISAAVVDDEALDAGLDPAASTLLIGVRLGSGTPYFRYAAALARRTDEMRARLAGYRDRGVGFVKWRADLDPLGGPASAYVDTGYLAACARLSLEAGLAPVLDVTMPNQRTHSLAVAIAVTANALRSLRDDLAEQGVDPGRTVIRLNMVRAGVGHAEQTTAEQVGRSTLRVLATGGAHQAPGVLFMSTGMDLSPACEDLAAIVTEAGRTGWQPPIGFGFGRALVERAVRAWGRNDDLAAQEALADSCTAAAAALEGRLVDA